jgi:hypothetical protein
MPDMMFYVKGGVILSLLAAIFFLFFRKNKSAPPDKVVPVQPSTCNFMRKKDNVEIKQQQ